MASSVAAAMPHTLPSLPISQLPRVRPPRFLPGQPRDNQLPQPEGDVPNNALWAQGKWRNPASNAIVDRRKVMSQQMKKAIEKHHHGSRIYAYYHLQTKQVVYSLTRIMQSGQVMPQLVYHGKKTVPAALRRDVWRPYFSIHFPENDAGRKVGLRTYQRLREFALRRQFDPDQKDLMTTQADVDKAVRDAGDPMTVRERYFEQDIKHRRQLHLPLLGQKLPKHLRARKLMNQTASSVADTAFVLGLAMQKLERLFRGNYDSQQALSARTERELKNSGPRGKKRLRAIRSREQEKSTEIAQRGELACDMNVRKGAPPMDKHIAEQLSMEFDGAVAGKSRRVLDVTPKDNTYDDDCNIHVLWADLRDGTFAESWPNGVSHGELQPAATSKRAAMRITQPEFIDVDGTTVSEQKQRVNQVSGSSVHVHGDEKPHEYRTFQEALMQQANQQRQQRFDNIELQREQEQRTHETGELPEKANMSEEAAFAEHVAKVQTDEPKIVLPNESKGLLERLKGWFGR